MLITQFIFIDAPMSKHLHKPMDIFFVIFAKMAIWVCENQCPQCFTIGLVKSKQKIEYKIHSLSEAEEFYDFSPKF